VCCRPSTHKLAITHAQCAWVSDQCALTMLHPLPTLAGDKTPFQQSGQVCAFLSPPPHPTPPHLLSHLCLHAAWAPPPTAMPHAPPSSDVEADAPQAAVATPRQNVARADGCKPVPSASFVGAIMWRRFVRTPSSQCPALLEQKCTPSLRPRAPTRQLLRLYARVVVFLMCASVCHAHLAFCIDHCPSLHAVTSWS
jgi:hypothetical protein